MIPMLFGIQQMAEGVIWLTFSHHMRKKVTEPKPTGSRK